MSAGRRVRWLSAYAVRLHVLVVIAVPLCLLAGWWQATRAMSGNTLSFFYAIEWPGFAAAAIYGWWQVLHSPPASRPAPAQPEAPAQREAAARRGAPPLRWDEGDESDALRAYNARLAELHATGRDPWRPRRRRRG